MKRCKKLAIFLVAVLLLSMVNTQTGILEAKAAVKNNITEVGIKALPKNNTIEVGEYFNFNPKVLNTQQGKGKETTGVVYFEVKAGTNTAGVQSSRWGYMYPVYAGQFEIRAVAFANTKDMNTWLAARKANGYIEDTKAGAKYVTAYSDWKTIQVTSDEEGLAVARWQKQLDLALKNKKVSNVRFTTDAEKEFTLKKGNYRYKTITIDAPNADVVNEGRFKEITVEQIKSSTFIEKSVGNKFVVKDANASFRVEKGAEINQLVFSPRQTSTNVDAKLNIIGNGGAINKVSITSKGKINLDGNTKNTVPVVVEDTAEGTEIKTNIKLTLDINASFKLEAGNNATDTTVNILGAFEAIISGIAKNLNLNISDDAEGAVIKTETTVTVQTESDVKIELGEGAEGSEITTTGDNVTVDVKNDTKEEVTVTDQNGNSTTVEKGEESKPVITPSPTPSQAPSNPPYVPTTPVPTPPVPTAIPVSKITVTSENNATEIKQGLKLQLTATVEPTNAANKAVTWESSDEKLAVVNEDGLVKGMDVGDVTIKALAADGSGVTGEIKLKITPNRDYIGVESITLNTGTLRLEKGTTGTLREEIKPDEATIKDVTWETSDPNVAIVDNGLVTAVGEGTAIITVTTRAGNLKVECTVIVTDTNAKVPVTEVVLNETDVTLNIEGTKQLTADVRPANASIKDVTWKSSNEAVVEVSADGLLTAKAEGRATITVTTVDGGKTATCTVKVEANSTPTPTPSNDATLAEVTYTIGSVANTISSFGTNETVIILDPKTTGNISLGYTTTDPKATVENSVTSVTINNIVTEVKVTVKAEDNVASKIYTLYFIASPIADNDDVTITTSGSLTATSSAIVQNGVVKVDIATGQSVTLITNSITGNNDVIVSYQWYEASAQNAVGSPIGNTNSNEFTVSGRKESFYYVEVKITFKNEEIITASSKKQ